MWDETLWMLSVLGQALLFLAIILGTMWILLLGISVLLDS